MGELKRVDGADWNLEIGAIAELIYRERSGTIPALLFDRQCEEMFHPTTLST